MGNITRFMTMMMAGGGLRLVRQPACFMDPVDKMSDDDIIKEMALIDQKQSGLSSRERNKVKFRFQGLRRG